MSVNLKHVCACTKLREKSAGKRHLLMLTMWALPCPSPPGKTEGSLPCVPCIWEKVAGNEDERCSHLLPPAPFCPEMAKLWF